MPHKVDIRVGTNIREIRNIRNLSQNDLGEGLGISFQQVQKYENGRNRVSASRLHEIAHVFEVPISELFADCDNVEAGEENAMDRILSDPQTRQLVAMFTEIEDPNTRQLVLQLVSKFAEKVCSNQGVAFG